jgi:mono/diheme cytochrome c family protein
MEPVTFGGSFTLTRVLGTVPVEADGSAHFELPALRSLFFVALDDRSLSVKRMQSFVTVQPGETTSCSGCHEQRTGTPPPVGFMRAMGRAPSQIEAFHGVPDVLDFPRDVQPILDRHCVECHHPNRREADVDLCGDRTPCYSMSYLTMIKQRLISDGRNRAGNRPPRTIGSSASRLLKLIDGAHYDVKLSPRERTTIILWIETGAAYAGTYAAYFSGMADVEFPVAEMTRRCGSCHGVKPGGQQTLAWEGYDTRPWTRLPLRFGDEGPAGTLCNLTRPERSPLLLAPLARPAGGYGTCRSKAGQSVFADTGDADYRKILAAIVDAKGQLDEIKRFDMPGFCPNEHYIREMKRYGILAAEHDPKTPLDPYATDQAYWRSMWYQPDGR